MSTNDSSDFKPATVALESALFGTESMVADAHDSARATMRAKLDATETNARTVTVDAARFKSVAELRDAMVSRGRDKAFLDRMMHPIPELPSVKDRAAYLVAKSTGKVVLDVGCTGPISQAIKKAAKGYYGVDRVPVEGCAMVELDHCPEILLKHEDVDTVICSEVLEHLMNPGNFLRALRNIYPGRTFYFTVPNAGGYVFKDGCEVVHAEHVCWYSHRTITTLLTRCHFKIEAVRWFNGPPVTAEGLIVVAK